MNTKKVKYFKRKNWKYKTTSVFTYLSNFCPIDGDFSEEFISLDRDGHLTIKEGYCWDGASGPAKDSPSIMRASLVHDALYQLMREGILLRRNRQRADKILYILCREDGMSWLIAKGIYCAVRLFGHNASLPTKTEAP